MSRPLRITAAVAAVGLQLVVLYAPRVPAVSSGSLPLDKVVHAGAFGLATAALIWAGVPRWAAVLVMVVHAPLSELIQERLLQQRSGDPADVAADLVGVAVAAVAMGRAAPRRQVHATAP